MAKSSERDQQPDNQHYNLQSQIDHMRGFQSALADGIQAQARAIEQLQAALPKDPDRCAARDCGAVGEIRVQGTIEVEGVVGLPGQISLTISSFLCCRCWLALTNAEANQATEEIPSSSDGPSRTSQLWGALWQK